jgi:hypothetical protein
VHLARSGADTARVFARAVGVGCCHRGSGAQLRSLASMTYEAGTPVPASGPLAAIRYAHYFSMTCTSSIRMDGLPYTAQSVAEFVGWLEPQAQMNADFNHGSGYVPGLPKGRRLLRRPPTRA